MTKHGGQGTCGGQGGIAGTEKRSRANTSKAAIGQEGVRGRGHFEAKREAPQYPPLLGWPRSRLSKSRWKRYRGAASTSLCQRWAFLRGRGCGGVGNADLLPTLATSFSWPWYRIFWMAKLRSRQFLCSPDCQSGETGSRASPQPTYLFYLFSTGKGSEEALPESS